MKQTKFLPAVLIAAAAVIAMPAAHAASVKVLGAGSSAMWQTAAIGAYAQLAGAGAGHYTIKGSCTYNNTTGNCAQINDSRLGTIANEPGNLWVVWNSPCYTTGAGCEIWAYLSVDSVVGNRSYFAVPRTTLQLSPAVLTTGGQNLIIAALFGGTSDDSTGLPSVVYTALTSSPGNKITTAFTDIRPEDAKFASCRTLNQLEITHQGSGATETPAYSGLGYGNSANSTCSSAQGAAIQSFYTPGTVANPVNFNIKGSDPISGGTIPKYTTIAVGATPVMFIVNRGDVNGLGQGLADNGGTYSGVPTITELDVPVAQQIWNGTECDTAVFPQNALSPVPFSVVQREPMSGTMNTTEFTTFRCGITNGEGSDPAGQCKITAGGIPSQAAYGNSQETGVNPSLANNNPLNLPCGNPQGIATPGNRTRAIGTGDEVGAVQHTVDSIGYSFWGFGNFSHLAGNAQYGYLTLNNVDPIQTQGGSFYATNGVLPVCNDGTPGVCPASPPGTNFYPVRQGDYPAWSLLRVVTNASGVSLTNTVLLVNAIQNNVNTTVPDFIPAQAVGGDPGLVLYRSHYKQSAVAPNNGLSGETEAGGDVGGCIEAKTPAPGVTSCHQ